MRLLKAYQKPKQHGPHRYTDPQGRTWTWDPQQKKYTYVPKPSVTSTALKEDRDKAIREEAANGASLKDLAEKFDLSNARIYGIVRGKTTAVTKKGAGAVRSSRERAYDAASQDAKDCADIIGVLPMGGSATTYVKDNLQSIFKTTKTDASYLKGVNTFSPLGGLGAWLADDDFTTQAETGVKEIVKDLENSKSDLYKEIEGHHLPDVLKDAKNWETALTAINTDKKNLEPILEFIGEENPKGAKHHGLPSNMASVPMAYSTFSIMMSHILPVSVLQAMATKPSGQNGKFAEGNEPGTFRTQDEDILKPLLKGMGISEELWNRRALNWNQSTFSAVLVACVFPDEYGAVVQQWLEPKELPKDPPNANYSVVIGGQGNDYGKQDTTSTWRTERFADDKVTWKIEDFRKAAEFIKTKYSKEWNFLHKYFRVDAEKLNQYADPKERYAGWRRSKYDNGQIEGNNDPFVSTIRNSLMPTKDIVKADTFLKDLDSVPTTKQFQGRDDYGDLTESQIRSNVNTSVRDLQAFCAKHSLGEPQVSDLFTPTDVLHPFHHKLSHEVQSRVSALIRNLDVFDIAKDYRLFGSSKAYPGSDSGPQYQHNPIVFRVEKSFGSGSGYGGRRGRTSYRGNVNVNPVEGKDIALRGLLRTVYDTDLNSAHRDSDINFTLGANYHARKMLKQRRSTIPLVWPAYRISSLAARSATYSAPRNEEEFKKLVTNTRASLVIKQITRRGKGVVKGSPDVVLSDIPKAEHDRIVAKIQADHDPVQHGNFRIKVNGVYRITDSRMEPSYQEAVKKYGNEKKDLYHGTSFKSGTPIIRGGFLIIRGKTTNGRNVWRSMGDGIYLADQSSKSAQYIGGDFSHHGSRGVLFLNDTAMGKVTENQNDTTAQTVFGAKGTRWENNEWAVKDPKAVIPRYWIDVESV